MHYRSINQGLTRRSRPTRDFMRYITLRMPAGEFFTDNMKSKIRSVRGHNYVQIYEKKIKYIKAYPMEDHNNQSVGDALSVMIQDTGIIQKLHTDNTPEMVGRKTSFFKRARKKGIDLTSIEPLRPDDNYGEVLVKKAKLLSSKLMVKRNIPLRLWYYALEDTCELESTMVPTMYRNKGRSGYEMIFGNTPDISEYVEFDLYDFCWYYDTPQSYPREKKSLERWLRVAHILSQSMVFYVMHANGKVIARSTVSPLEPSDYDVSETKHRIHILDETLKKSIRDYRNATNVSNTQLPEMENDDLQSQLSLCFDLDPLDIDGSDEEAASNNKISYIDDTTNTDVESTAFEKILGLYIELPGDDGESMILAKVQDRKRDHDGKLIGSFDPNPILNTAMYNVETPDGNIQEYTANGIATNLWNEVDEDGYDYNLLYEIIGHRRNDDAVKIENSFYETKSGIKKKVMTTKGWDFHVRWKNGDTSCIALKDIKETNPIEIAEYVKLHKLRNEPEFTWWINIVLKRRDVMVSKVARRIKKKK